MSERLAAPSRSPSPAPSPKCKPPPVIAELVEPELARAADGAPGLPIAPPVVQEEATKPTTEVAEKRIDLGHQPDPEPKVANADSPRADLQPAAPLSKIGNFFSQPGWLVSLILHLALMIVLLCITLSRETNSQFVLVHSDSNEISQEVFEFSEAELESPDLLESVDVQEPAVTEDALVDLSKLAVEQPVSLVSIEVGNDSVADIGKAAEGLASAEPKSATSFFGKKAIARNIVFVVDNSNSMGGGKLETALVEMNKAISQLKPTQKFYVIFYSDTAYPLFHPQPARKLIPATAANKRRTAYWLESVQMCLQTRGSLAIEMARQLGPDLIYLLGDGAFTDKAAKELLGNPIRNATIHTLGMQVKPKDANAFQAIADKHGGTYVDVGVTLEGKALFKRTGGRPKNNKQGPVWGIALKKK